MQLQALISLRLSRQLRGWLSRLTGRPPAEFERAAPLMEAVRRQFRLSRDEDLQAVSVWRRAQPAPPELSKLQLTVRPENGARLRRLVQQLGSEEAAIEFLLQMDENCGAWRVGGGRKVGLSLGRLLDALVTE